MQLPTPNTPDLWRHDLPIVKPDGHKYDRGHLLIAGGEILTGASRLAARAAQRIGAGVVTLAAPATAYEVYAAALESIMVQRVATLDDWQQQLADPKKNTVLIGCGLGIGGFQREQVRLALASKKPCVLDADALNNFADTPNNFFALAHSHCILTPHEGEFARLFGSYSDPSLPKAERASRAAQLSHAFLVLKGSETIIASPDGTIISNTHATPWLATAGSGDVLAGMIAGLMTQKMPIFSACCAATWLHGDAGQRCGEGLIAEDIVAKIPELLKCLPPRQSRV